MPEQKTKFNRRSIRLPGYDYTQDGAYFITLVTHHREHLLSDIVEGQIKLQPIGNIANEVWQSIPLHFPQASVDYYIIMPNHIHGIIIINQSILTQRAVPQQNLERFGSPVKGSLPTIIRSFKSEVTRRVNIWRHTPGGKLWQRNYYEHVIRNEKAFQSILDYILANPHAWHGDKFLR